MCKQMLEVPEYKDYYIERIPNLKSCSDLNRMRGYQESIFFFFFFFLNQESSSNNGHQVTVPHSSMFYVNVPRDVPQLE